MIQSGWPTPTAVTKWGEVKVYLWNGTTFDEASLPEDLPSPDIKLPKDCGAVKNYGGAATPLRWLKSGDLELSSDLMMLCREMRATPAPASCGLRLPLMRNTTRL